MDLREKIAHELVDAIPDHVGLDILLEVADRILAIPEIKEALEAKALKDLGKLGQDWENR